MAGRLTNIIIEDGNSARLFKTSEVKEVDPFAPYLGKSPSLHMHLGSEVQNGVIIDKVVFNSREYKTNTGIDSTKIFAAIARPERPGRYPDYWYYMEAGVLQKWKKQKNGQPRDMWW